MGDVALRVAARRAERVDADGQGGCESREAQPPAADDPRVREGVELGRRLLDRALERLKPTVRIADREVDPDAVHAGADLGSELGVDHCGLLERLVLVRADDSIAALLVEHGRAQSLPAPALTSLLASAATDADVHGQRRRQRTAQQVGEP